MTTAERPRNSIQLLAPKDYAGRESAAKRLATMVLTFQPGKRLRVTVEIERAERSDAQNRSLFGVAYPALMAHMGLRGEEEKEELHTVLCGLFFGWTQYEILGQRKKKPKRATTTNEQGDRDVIPVTEFMAFYSFVQQRGAEIGCDVPDPDPEWFTKEQPGRAA